jgi:hypothetical protein
MSYRWLPVLASACLFLCGCSDGDRATDATSPLPSSGDRAPRLVTYQDNGFHSNAAFQSVLSVNDAGCFALSDGSTVMLPDTWTVSLDGRGVVSSTGTELRLGDSFEAGGGFGGPPRSDLTTIQRSCPSDGPPYANGGRYSSFAVLWGVEPR